MNLLTVCPQSSQTVKLAAWPDAAREAEVTNPTLPSLLNPGELSAEQSQQQLQRILHSSTLRNSVTLQQLLQFLVTRSLEGKPDGLKEYTIGLEAFGRKADFDPKTDTIVRVQTHRLRQKLKEYYEQEGIHDPILIEIPKGHYCPIFRARVDSRIQPELDRHSLDPIVELETGADPLAPHGGELTKTNQVMEADRGRFHRYLFRPATIIVVCLLSLAIGYFVGDYRSQTAAAGDSFASGKGGFIRSAPDPVKTFWAAFLQNDRAPIIAYPNAVFLLDDSNDLLRFRRGASDNRGARVDEHLALEFASNPTLVANAGQLYYEDGYTGTGELEGVAMLTTLFAQMGIKPIIKTSRNITPEDLQEHSVILLGSPFQNIAVAQLFADGDFAFQNPDSHREQWRAQIVNARPEGNEKSAYGTERDPDTQVLKQDYSLISIQPGVVAGHSIAVLGGLDTKGTEGVTRFMTSASGIESLSAALAAKGLSIKKVAAASRGEMPWFQALVLVQLEKGDQVLSTELTTVHALPRLKSSVSGVEDSTASAKK